ncbi:MAG: hypothetical protein HZA32_02785 [Opitutae bacterium]|nr:hypothetical protein [Opitutae bacterium]
MRPARVARWLDRLTQKVRSYVDTSGRELRLFDGLKTTKTGSLEERTAPQESKP